MALAALLLLQALALCSSSGLLHQDNDACAEGAESACLAGSPASRHAEDVQEEAAFIQERASRSGSKRATGTQHVLAAWRLPGPTDDDYVKCMGAINDTVNKIQKAVDLVNSTIVDVVETVQSQYGTLATALDLAKSGAEHLKIIIGEEAVTSVETLMDKMAKTSDSFMAVVNKTAGEAQEEVQKLWSELSSEQEEIMQKITDADQQIQSVIDQNATLLQVRSHGIIDWLKRIFGFGRKQAPSPCEKAQESLNAANSSMQEFGAVLVRFNTSAMDKLFNSLDAKLRSGVESLKSAVESAISGAGDAVPTSVAAAVRKAIDTFGSVVDFGKKKLAPVEEKIAHFFEEAKSPLQSARGSLDSSEARLVARCEPAAA